LNDAFDKPRGHNLSTRTLIPPSAEASSYARLIFMDGDFPLAALPFVDADADADADFGRGLGLDGFGLVIGRCAK
jgi:hypothetical protein